MNRNTTYHQSIAILCMVVLCCFIGCSHDDKPRIEAVVDRGAMPMLLADTVNTLISDSGITRYRIKTARWEVYDKAKPAYWEFPEGIYLEKFDHELKTEATLEADYAHYNEDEQIWELDGNVKTLNLKGERFLTEQLFWNQKTERVWSDSSITIIRETSTIQGIGFESNQTMTKYTILQPQGTIPVKDD